MFTPEFIASVNLWSLLTIAEDRELPGMAGENIAAVIKCELTLEVTEHAWVIRIHGAESGLDYAVLTYARPGHVLVETNVDRDDMIQTRRVAW